MNVNLKTTIRRVVVLALAWAAMSVSSAEKGSAPPDAKIQVGTGRVAISFDNNRRFFLSDKTVITQRGVPVDAEVLIQVGTGRRARFLVADDVNETFTGGTLTFIEFGSQIQGPVTSLDPLTVFNYEIGVNSATVLTNVPGDNVANIELDSHVVLAGFSDVEGNFQVTGLEYQDEALEEWVVTGPVTALSSEGFSIGPQAIVFNGVTPEECENGIDVGSYVQVEADPTAGFQQGDTITSTTEIECQSDDLGGDPGAIVPAYVEGFVTMLSANSGFSVGEQSIVTTPETEFENGDATDLQLGVRVQVEGLLNTDTGILDAQEVEFSQVRVEAEGPLTDADIDGETVTLLGVTMHITPQTEDEDGILNGLSEAKQVRVDGYIDAEGAVIVDELEERGAPNSDDVSLRAVVESIDQPILTVLGLTVDTLNSVLYLDDESVDPVEEAVFFETVRVGAELAIEGASYDSKDRLLSGGEIAVESESEEEAEEKGASVSKGMSNFGVGIGVIVESGDSVFIAGFE